MRLIVAGNWYGAHVPFIDLFEEVVETSYFEMVEPTNNDVIIFGGGADIWAGLYKQTPNRYNGTSRVSIRDSQEADLFNRGMKAGAKFLGICRGAQLLCALSGGSLIQHVTNHGGHDHPMETDEGEILYVSSAHHQMMNPAGTKHKLIAWSKDKRSTCYLVEDEKDIEIDKEPEVVYFPDTSSLAIQYHPEFMSQHSAGVHYARDLVSKYLLEK